MQKLVIIGTIAALAVAQAPRGSPINAAAVNAIRSKNVTWETHDPETNPLRNKTREELIDMLSGTFIVPPRTYTEADLAPSATSPANYDPRGNKCIHPIRDQAKCGSCWAFGATEALSDRFCLAGQDVILSPQELVNCVANNYGCDGGYLFFTWWYLQSPGAVEDSCQPYVSGTTQVAGSCSKSCNDGSSPKRYKCGKLANPSKVADTQDELFNNGPLEGAFTVYEDFMSYKSGVYYHATGAQLGGHAIKVIGYGTDESSGLSYWLCANSWGTSWGDSGFFKIKQGDCGINDQMYGCAPTVSSSLEMFA